MPAKEDQNQQKQESRQRQAVIGKHVLHDLGLPPSFQLVQVRPLWGDHYRVNVLVGDDAVSAKVAHSYFLVVNGDGNITASTPTITRQYSKE